MQYVLISLCTLARLLTCCKVTAHFALTFVAGYGAALSIFLIDAEAAKVACASDGWVEKLRR